MSASPDPQRIRELNDNFRTTLTGGSLMLTAGIVALGPEIQHNIIEAVRTFDAFTPDNDPYGEHDFGALEVNDERIFFKIDYFDPMRAIHSEDPADARVTERMMTIMLASEY